MDGEKVEELEVKKVEERKVLEGSLKEEEERFGKKVVVILDSQEEGMEVDGSGLSWDSEKVEEKLGMRKGDVEKIVVKKGRVEVDLKKVKDARVLEDMEVDKWEEVLGVGVGEVKKMGKWVGMVIPAMGVQEWMGRLGELGEKLKGEGVKLMRELVWLLDEKKIKEWKLREVGVLIFVARESERVRYLEEGISWGKGRLKVHRYVGRKEVEWCTKYASLGYSWWRCEMKFKRCSVCGVKDRKAHV